jgi:hypothetical protein
LQQQTVVNAPHVLTIGPAQKLNADIYQFHMRLLGEWLSLQIAERSKCRLLITKNGIPVLPRLGTLMLETTRWQI